MTTASYEISAQELVTTRQQMPDVRVIDVREPWEYDICIMPFAERVPLGTLADASETWQRNQSLIIVCHKGVRSLKATLWLQNRGFPARSLRGGIHAWAEEIDRSMATY